jgi:hypothetical protein
MRPPSKLDTNVPSPTSKSDKGDAFAPAKPEKIDKEFFKSTSLPTSPSEHAAHVSPFSTQNPYKKNQNPGPSKATTAAAAVLGHKALDVASYASSRDSSMASTPDASGDEGGWDLVGKGGKNMAAKKAKRVLEAQTKQRIPLPLLPRGPTAYVAKKNAVPLSAGPSARALPPGLTNGKYPSSGPSNANAAPFRPNAPPGLPTPTLSNMSAGGMFRSALPSMFSSSIPTGPVGVAGLMSPPGLGESKSAQTPAPASGSFMDVGFNGGIGKLMGWLGPGAGTANHIIDDSADIFKSKGLSPSFSATLPGAVSRSGSFNLDNTGGGAPSENSSRKSSESLGNGDASNYFSAFTPTPKLASGPTMLKLPKVPHSSNTSAAHSKMEVEEVLAKLNLSAYSRIFTDNQIDVETLLMLSEEHLKEMKLPMGPRVKLLSYIEAGGLM